MSQPLSSSAQRVQQSLQASGVSLRVIELPKSTRSAPEAAEAVGCRVEQIVKSLVFRRRDTGLPVLVLASGANRVNEERMAELLSEPVERADPEFVRRHSGFSIGGVPPAGHPEPLETFIDEELMLHDEIWAAAGTPNAVFRLTPADLLAVTSGRVVRIK